MVPLQSFFNDPLHLSLGPIPSEFGNMESLQVLFLHENNLTGQLPSEVGRLSNLLYFYAYNNSLVGEITTVFGSLEPLLELSLHNNRLQSSIASELGQLSNLRLLDLSENDLSGSIPVELSRLSKLQALYLDGNNLTGTVPKEMAWLWLNNGTTTSSSGAMLADFHIHQNPSLSGTIPEEFCLPHGKPCPRWSSREDGCTIMFDCTADLCGCDCDCLGGGGTP